MADTWWFGLTSRLSEADFRALAALRKEQGFSAVQLVVGVPPEVCPENENARSEAGFPWSLDGSFNGDYLLLAKDRIRFLNETGLRVIVYGAWGHHIDWLGRAKIIEWWGCLMESLDCLDVVYCLCGESNIWIDEASSLLPDRSTDDVVAERARGRSLVKRLLDRATAPLKRKRYRQQVEKRRQGWSAVLEAVAERTDKPILIHPTAVETGFDTVSNPGLLAANTAQTGHDKSARNRLWQLPVEALENDPSGRGYINLEPWYEGILDQFGPGDQLFAYWVSMLAGAMSFCYGAHGIWNVGDGRFLAHWGGQTFQQALALDTPRLLGLSHAEWIRQDIGHGETFFQVEGEELETIGKKAGAKAVQFFPDIASADFVPEGKTWLPLEGRFEETRPEHGPVVVFQN